MLLLLLTPCFLRVRISTWVAGKVVAVNYMSFRAIELAEQTDYTCRSLARLEGLIWAIHDPSLQADSRSKTAILSFCLTSDRQVTNHVVESAVLSHSTNDCA